MQTDERGRWRTIALPLAVAGLLGLSALGDTTARLAAQERAAPAAADQPGNNSQVTGQDYLSFTFEALGIRYTLAFLVISFTFVAFLVMNLLALRRESICPPHLAAAFEAQVQENKLQEAFDLAKSDDSMLGQMLAAGMQHLQHGYAKAETAMGEVGEEENLKLEQRLSFLSLVGTIAPMVGLLGTVDGMVQSFTVIAQSDTQPKPSQLAGGISMALITTLVGLILAIPAIIAFNLLKNRLTRLVMETGQQVGRLMSRFENQGPRP
jgi:biopolymer transport protein ExbB